MNDAFNQALADAAEDGKLDLDDLRDKCLAAIGAGGGHVSFTTRAGQNGKTAEQECKMDASALLAAVNQALRINRGTSVGVTYVDFSEMP